MDYEDRKEVGLKEGTLYSVSFYEPTMGGIVHGTGIYKGWKKERNEDGGVSPYFYAFKKVDAQYNEIPVPPEFNIDDVEIIERTIPFQQLENYYIFVITLTNLEELDEYGQALVPGMQAMKLGGRKNKKTRNRRRKNKKTRKNKWKKM